MAPPTVLASDIMDGSAAILNDTARRLYTNTVQLPYLKMANEELEQLLAVYGIDITHETSAVIEVAAEAVTLTLPNDFLVPIKLYERLDGSTSEDDWVEMREVKEIPPQEMANELSIWAFEDNAIKFVGATVDREVLLKYSRMLSAISSVSSPIDEYKLKPWLQAKTAELCARFIGINKPFATDIKTSKVDPAEDNLIRLFVLDQQGQRHRRKPFPGITTIRS